MGTLRAEPGQRDAIVAALIRYKPELVACGCLVYEVGTSPAAPDLVYVLEVWESAEAHRASLGVGTIREAVHSVLPLLDGEIVSMKFDIVGSPLTGDALG